MSKETQIMKLCCLLCKQPHAAQTINKVAVNIYIYLYIYLLTSQVYLTLPTHYGNMLTTEVVKTHE